MLVRYLRNSGRMSEKAAKKIRGILITIGLLCLALSIILSKFLPAYDHIDFIAGFFMGLAIIFNIAGLVLSSQERNK